MKQFTFPLNRVMDWRRAQTRIEESRLQRLLAEARGIDAREASLNEERAASERALLAGPAVTGFELARWTRSSATRRPSGAASRTPAPIAAGESPRNWTW